MFSRRYEIDTAKTTQFSDAWIVLAIIITVAGLILRSAYLTAAAATMLAVVIVAWGWNRVALRGVRYARVLSETRAFQGEEITLRLEVHNGKLLPLTWLTVRDVFPSGLPIDGKELPPNPATNLADFASFWMPGANQQVARTFRISCTQRGLYRFGPARVQTGDPFGFFENAAALAPEQRLIVYPRLYPVADLRLPARNPFGARRSPEPLHDDPLRSAGVRDWTPEDGLRRIHWPATARAQALQSRVYEPSEEAQLLIFLNVATMERHWQGVLPELHERAVSVAGSVAALAVEQRLPVGLIVNGAMPGSDQGLRLLPGRSPNQLLHVLELLAAVTPFATAPIEELLLREAPRAPWGATLVVVSAIAHDDLLAALLDLAAVGRKVLLFTLARKPPTRLLRGVEVYHLPHLVDGVVSPVQPDKVTG